MRRVYKKPKPQRRSRDYDAWAGDAPRRGMKSRADIKRELQEILDDLDEAEKDYSSEED